MKFWRERHNNLVRPHKRECMVAAKFGPDLRLVSLKKAGGNWWRYPKQKTWSWMASLQNRWNYSMFPVDSNPSWSWWPSHVAQVWLFIDRVAVHIERFHSRGQHLCKFIGTKESICIRKEFNSHRTGLGHKHGHHFTVLGHQYGPRDVMWKHSIASYHKMWKVSWMVYVTTS